MLSVLLCSIDSFLASLGIGLVGCSKTSRRKFIIAFAAGDLSATLAGASLHSGLAQIHAGAVAAFLVIAVLAIISATLLAYRQTLGSLFIWVPLLLSLDNFVAALLNGPAHTSQSPLIAGLASGLLAWSGFDVARFAGPLFSRRSAVLMSVSLMMLAFVLAN